MITVSVPVYAWYSLDINTDDEQEAIKRGLEIVRKAKLRTSMIVEEGMAIKCVVTNIVIDSGYQVGVIKK